MKYFKNKKIIIISIISIAILIFGGIIFSKYISGNNYNKVATECNSYRSSEEQFEKVNFSNKKEVIKINDTCNKIKKDTNEEIKVYEDKAKDLKIDTSKINKDNKYDYLEKIKEEVSKKEKELKTKKEQEKTKDKGNDVVLDNKTNSNGINNNINPNNVSNGSNETTNNTNGGSSNNSNNNNNNSNNNNKPSKPEQVCSPWTEKQAGEWARNQIGDYSMGNISDGSFVITYPDGTEYALIDNCGNIWYY